MKKHISILSLISLSFLLLVSHNANTKELDTDFLFEGEPEGPMKRREEEKKKEELKIEAMIFIKGGCYEMGDTFGDGSSEEKPVHTVCVDDFYMGETEVTQAKWQEVMGDNPSYFKGPDNPVERVSWDDIQVFIKKLNEKTGRNFRLPTEAEWEYAARSGGKKERYAGTSNDLELGEYAWYSSNSGSTTHPVKQKKPNGLGLYDMSGNVWEWVSDWYDENYYKNSPKDNPKGSSTRTLSVLRGGSWLILGRYSRTAYRDGFYPVIRVNSFGFRLARTP